MKINQKIFLRSGENKLFGEIYIPEKKNGVAVILAHPFGSTMDTVRGEAKLLAQEGYTSVIFDFPGGSLVSKSGSVHRNSLVTETEDLMWVIDYVKENISKEIVVIGYSQGGAVAALAAAQRDDLKGLILFYPALVIPDHARQLFKSKEEIPDEVYVLGYPMGGRYYKDVYDMDIFERIKSINSPTLILHGINDELIPLSYIEESSKLIDDSKLLLYEAGHGFFMQGNPAVRNEIIHFISTL